MGWTNDHITVGYVGDYQGTDLARIFLNTEPQVFNVIGEVKETGHGCFFYHEQPLHRWPLLVAMRRLSRRKHVPLHISFGW